MEDDDQFLNKQMMNVLDNQMRDDNNINNNNNLNNPMIMKNNNFYQDNMNDQRMNNNINQNLNSNFNNNNVINNNNINNINNFQNDINNQFNINNNMDNISNDFNQDNVHMNNNNMFNQNFVNNNNQNLSNRLENLNPYIKKKIESINILSDVSNIVDIAKELRKNRNRQRTPQQKNADIFNNARDMYPILQKILQQPLEQESDIKNLNYDRKDLLQLAQDHTYIHWISEVYSKFCKKNELYKPDDIENLAIELLKNNLAFISEYSASNNANYLFLAAWNILFRYTVDYF